MRRVAHRPDVKNFAARFALGEQKSDQTTFQAPSLGSIFKNDSMW